MHTRTSPDLTINIDAFMLIIYYDHIEDECSHLIRILEGDWNNQGFYKTHRNSAD